MAAKGKHSAKKKKELKEEVRGLPAEDSVTAPEEDAVPTEENGEKKTGRREYTHRRLPLALPLMLVLVLFCFIMISPLNGCVLGSRDYIGTAAAAGIALGDAGIIKGNAQNLETDMIMLDGEAYYKVQFNGTVTEFRYIVDAQTGEIILQTFEHMQTDD